MENNMQIQVFNNEQFGEIRTVVVDGEPWFVAADVCKILEIKNVSQAVDILENFERSMLNIGRQGEANMISESGFYALVLRSRKPAAKPFRLWVTTEVLPTIRKTGRYQMENQYNGLSPQLALFQGILDELKDMEAKAKERDKKILELEEGHKAITNAVVPILDNWQEEIFKKCKRIAYNSDTYATVGIFLNEMYKQLENRAGCNLKTRLENTKNRMRTNGAAVAEINKVSKLSLIANDKKLREVFEKIVMEQDIHSM